MCRECRLDSIKGILITLVILGHLIGECGTGIVNYGVQTFIYIFHMPLFVLLSGYFTKLKDDKMSFRKGLLSIAIPLGVFQFINTILLLAFNRHVGLEMFVTPYWTLWYLLSLIFWRIILQYSPKYLLNKPRLYLSIAFGISIICGLMHYGRIFSIQRTLNFFPFFLYGYYMRQGNTPLKLWNNHLSYCFIFLIIILIVLRLYPENCGLLLRGADHYGLTQIPSKVYMLACAFVTSLSFFNIMKENNALSEIGKDSLLYYLYHGIIIRFAVQPLVLHLGLPQSFLFVFLYCSIIVSMIYAISRTYLFRWLCNPFAKK